MKNPNYNYSVPEQEIIGLLERIANALEQQQVDAELAPVNDRMTRTLQERADYNRDNAANLYSDELVYVISGDFWVERKSMSRVVFTPYGWRLASEVGEHLGD